MLHMCKNQVMLLTERARGERAATRTCAGDQKYKNTNEKKWTEVWKVRFFSNKVAKLATTWTEAC